MRCENHSDQENRIHSLGASCEALEVSLSRRCGRGTQFITSRRSGDRSWDSTNGTQNCFTAEASIGGRLRDKTFRRLFLFSCKSTVAERVSRPARSMGQLRAPMQGDHPVRVWNQKMIEAIPCRLVQRWFSVLNDSLLVNIPPIRRLQPIFFTEKAQ